MSLKDAIICSYPRTITVSEIREIIANKNEKEKATLISVIDHRLSRRFLKVIDNASKEDLSSFMTMAICCLLIETLECFYQGLPDTNKNGESERMFKDFFYRAKEDFPGLTENSTDFYLNVRGGLLHQAETMNGWFLIKSGKIFEESGKVKIINGDLFYNTTKKAISDYLKLLEEKDFNDEILKRAFDKLEHVCKNCQELRKYKNDGN